MTCDSGYTVYNKISCYIYLSLGKNEIETLHSLLKTISYDLL